MTTEERLQRIEAATLAIAEAQARTQTALTQAAESQAAMYKAIGEMTGSIAKYTDAANARMTRLEENLDGLIRAITAEHSNGKSKN